MNDTQSEQQNKAAGQALVEFALLITFLVTLVMAVLAFGMILMTDIGLSTTANLAARNANLSDMRIEYCKRVAGDHYNQPIYDTVVKNLGDLQLARVRDIIIFRATTSGGLDTTAVDVLLNDNTSVTGCYDYRGDGGCDFTAGTFTNGLRCSTEVSIGVEVRYLQPVPVPLINLITGDPMIIPARVIMHIED